MNDDIFIIVAGPGGIFTDCELIPPAPHTKVAVFEAGHTLHKVHTLCIPPKAAMVSKNTNSIIPGLSHASASGTYAAGNL